VQNKFHS